MDYDLAKRNDAIAVNGNILNGQTVDIAITVRGSDFYFAICSVMGLVAFTTIGLSFMKPRTDRIFFYITAALNFTAFIAYFTMGSNLGWAPIGVEFVRSDPRVAGLNREIFYVRYIDWVVTTPLLLMDLLLTAALPWPTIIWVIFLDWVMIITGLVGALVSTRYKFGFFAIGCAAMLYIFYELAYIGRLHARALGKDVYRVYTACGVWTLFIWALYPVAWGVSEGGNVIAPDSEAVFYGVLDFCAKPVFSIMLIVGHWNISPSRLGLQIREYGSQSQTSDHEKSGHQNDVVTAGGVGSQTNTGMNATPPYGTSTGHDGGHSGVIPTNAHAQHTTGLAPTHENTTTESGDHLNTHRH